jgi:hypothetical protein
MFLAAVSLPAVSLVMPPRALQIFASEVDKTMH